MRTWLFICAMLVASPMWGADPLKIDVSPRIGRAPQDIHIRTRVAQDERNRALCIEVVGPQDRTSCWELEGKDAPITTETWLKSFPGGSYVVHVTLQRVEGGKSVEVTRSASVCIVGGVRDAQGGCEPVSDGQESLPGLAEG